MSGGTAPEGTMPESLPPLLVTRSGTFHLDDAFTYAVLRLALGLGEVGRDHALIRRPTRCARRPRFFTVRPAAGVCTLLRLPADAARRLSPALAF